jgi:4-amino-4-deoxy-L-arabinose transferase-like glycosyltransferase
MRIIIFASSHYAALALFATICYIFGVTLTRAVRYTSPVERFGFSVTIGLGAIAYLVLFLGLIHLLFPWLVLLALVAGLVACLIIWKDDLRRWSTPGKESETSGKYRRYLVLALVVLVALGLSVPFLLLPLYPPILAPDATSYHLASAKMFVQNSGMVFTPNLRYPVFTLTNNMLFTLALLFYDDVLAQLIEFLMLVTLAASVVAFGKRFFSERTAWWSAAILLSNPLVIWLGRVAYVDMGVLLFTTTAVFAFWNWMQVRERAWLILSACLFGFAIGTKQTALFFVGILSLTAFWKTLKQRDFTSPVLFASIALLVASPWFLRSFYYTGNPVFPFLYETFGRWFGYGQSKYEYYQEFLQAITTSGIGKSFKSLITLPWQLAFNQQAFVQEAAVSRIYFYALPLVLVVCSIVKKLRGLAALTLAYILFWFYSVQVLRYLVLIIALLSLVTAASIDLLLRRLPLGRWQHSSIVVAIVFVAIVSPAWKYAIYWKLALGPLPITQAERETSLNRWYLSYPAYKLMNDLKGRNYSVYAFNDTAMAYFTDGYFMGDWFGPTSYSRIINNFSNGQSLYQELRLLKADYLVLRDSPLKLKPPTDEFFTTHFKPLIQQPDLMLFEIREKPFQTRQVELFQNPGFESLNKGLPIGWSFSGSPRVITPPSHKVDSVVVQSSGAGEVLFQRLTVSESQYMFSLRVKAVNQAGRARLQINWLDDRGSLVKEQIELLEVGPDWSRHELKLLVPPQSVTAVVYASALNPSVVWFDDFSCGTTIYESSP